MQRIRWNDLVIFVCSIVLQVTDFLNPKMAYPCCFIHFTFQHCCLRRMEAYGSDAIDIHLGFEKLQHPSADLNLLASYFVQEDWVSPEYTQGSG